jgi:integrase
MASIHKRPRSPYYFAAWRGEGGRLFLRSTKQTDRSGAKSVALQFERAAKDAMAGNLTEQQARKVLNDILETTGQAIRCPSVKDFLDGWLEAKEGKASAGTIVRYAQTVRDFLAHLGPQAKQQITALTSRHFETYLASRKRDKCSSTTITLDGKILRAAFTKARKQGLIPHNPAEAVDLPGVRSVTRGVFTPAEVGMLVAAGGGEWPTLITVAYFTGQRLTDCTRMAWADVDLAAGTWTLKQRKTGTELVLPLHPDLLTHLESLATGDTAQEHVMPHMATLGPGGRHGLSEGFKRICVEAGVDMQPVKNGGQRTVSKRSFHALRHSFTSALLNANVPPELRMLLTGHKSKEVHRGYSHAELATLRTAVEKLPGIK